MTRTRYAAATAVAAFTLGLGLAPTPAFAETIEVATPVATVSADTASGEVSVTARPTPVGPAVEPVLAQVDRVAGGRDVRLGMPALGYIEILSTSPAVEPTWSVHLALANPAWWTCTDNGGYFTVAFEVTCVPTAPVLPYQWNCSVLHAAVTGLSNDALARTGLDCDGDGTPEVQTQTVAGMNGDSVLAPSGMPVGTLVCRLDSGGMLPAFGTATAFCGDPDAPTVD